MKGITRKRGATWSYQFSYTEGGTRKHVQRGGFRLQKDAQDALTIALAAIGKGDKRPTIAPSTQPFGDYLTEWLEARIDLKASSRAGYTKTIDCWLRPHVGAIALRDLTPAHFTSLYAKLRTDGGRRGGKLSERSIGYAHSVARVALAQAVEDGRLAMNPVASVPRTARPKALRGEMKTWTTPQVRAFLTHCAEDRLHPLWALALDSGLRRGELCGLRWDDIDLETGQLAVRRNRVLAGGVVVEGTPKSKRARTISLAPGTLTLLTKWQTRTLKAERLAAGPAYVDSGYVFVDELGQPLAPDAVSFRFERASAAAPVPVIRLHDLRHTSATLDLAAGIHPKIVQERLGHANISLTLDLYSHVVPGMQEDAAVLRGNLLYGATAS